MKKLNEYDQQAVDFATGCDLTMKANYIGHFARFGDNITAVYNIVLQRPGRKPWAFQFSTSINDSWSYHEDSRQFKRHKGLPMRIKSETIFAEYLMTGRTQYNQYTIRQVKTNSPTLYDILACIEKYDPESFSDFCGNFGYDEDSKRAERTYQDVREEWRECERMFGDVMEELAEIN